RRTRIHVVDLPLDVVASQNATFDELLADRVYPLAVIRHLVPLRCLRIVLLHIMGVIVAVAVRLDPFTFSSQCSYRSTYKLSCRYSASRSCHRSIRRKPTMYSGCSG